MNNDSVKLGKHICTVCTKEFETGEVVLNSPKDLITGYSACPECAEYGKQGYITLVGIDASKSTFKGSTITPDNAIRTGRIVRMKKATYVKIFNTIPNKDKICFIEDSIITKLEELMNNEQSDQ